MRVVNKRKKLTPALPQDTTASVHRFTPRNEGFTLVEVVVTTAIMSGAFVFLIGGLINISEMNEIGEDHTQATMQLTNTLEALRGLPFEEFLAYEPVEMSNLGATASMSLVCIAADGKHMQMPVKTKIIAENLPNPLEVRATVLWRDTRGRPQAQTAGAMYRR